MGSSFYDDLFMREVGIKELYVKVLGSTVRDNLSTVSRERLLARKVGSFSRFNNCTVEGSCLSAHAACSFVEHPINLTKPTNKVFASSWLTPDKVVFGTKCNKLIIYDIHRRESMLMDMLCSSGENVSDAACGIHAIDINPSHTMLATGAKSPFEVGIYRLPSFEPVTVGVGAHTDWIFDMEWLDDSFLATCCRDGQIALWKFSPYAADEVTCGHVKWSRCINKNFPETSCVIRKRLVGCEKIRSLTYSYRFKVLVTVSLNSFLHVLDVETFSQVRMDELKNRTECVCICSSPCENLVAIGCLGSFVIYDLRDGHWVKFKLLRRSVHIPIFENDQMRIGVRSISWRDDLITIGTGAGEVLFFDTRTRDFLFCDCDSKRSLVVGPGWQFCDETIMEIFHGINIPNAVYTHCYDSPGSKLFVAGGPISAAVVGNYAAVFHPCENLVAIGCLGSFVIYDLRDGHWVKFKLLRRSVHIPIFENDQMRIGVRSISWRDDLITIGTGAGEVLFFDTRTRDFLFCDCDSKLSLVVGPGWQFCDETIMEIFHGINIPNAVYTHCYDSPGSKLFVAGGPISAAVVGNYAAVFQ